jgi:preprotein translocase subunit YajC
MFFVATAYAMGASGGAQGQAGNPMQFFIMIGLIIAIFYFLLIRPQQKKQKDHRRMIDSLEKGDEVVTAGGVHGIISKVKDEIVFLEVFEQVKLKVSRASIAVVKKKSEE